VRYNGFSLIEVMVALTIVGLVFTVFMSGASRSLDAIVRVDQSDRRLEFVRAKLAELDLCGPIRAGDSASGIFEDGTRWRADAFPFIPPSATNPSSVVRIVLTIQWQGRSGQEQKREIAMYRYVPPPGAELITSLDDQLHDLR
jgi:prepilin-type N-terminal cleavage/methylation domain-containing protein